MRSWRHRGLQTAMPVSLGVTHPLQLQITDGAEPQRWWWNTETTAKWAPLTRRRSRPSPRAWAEVLSFSSEENKRWVCVYNCLDRMFCLSGNVSLKSLLRSKHILLFMSALQKHMLSIQWYTAKTKQAYYIIQVLILLLLLFSVLLLFFLLWNTKQCVWQLVWVFANHAKE